MFNQDFTSWMFPKTALQKLMSMFFSVRIINSTLITSTNACYEHTLFYLPPIMHS